MTDFDRKYQDCIVINEQELADFKHNLKMNYNMLCSNGKILQENQFQNDIIEKIEELKYYFQDKLRKQMDKDNYNKFISGMDAIYTDFFRSLPKLKIFSYLQEETDQYFFFSL